MDIQNFVFFDIETTGLPQLERNQTRITEMCFVAVEKDHINLRVYPRVQNKLSFCFNPQKTINPIASQLTGLTNDLLKSQPDFGKQTCEIVNNFLKLQSGPICFVAHNGNNFDYRILKAEFHKAGCELIDKIVCIDSLHMFRDLEFQKIIESKLEEENSHTENERNNDGENVTTSANFSSGSITETSPIPRKKPNLGRQSYKLCDIHKRLTKKEDVKAHLADADVNMLIECAAIFGQDFVDWANIYAKEFSEIPMMQSL